MPRPFIDKAFIFMQPDGTEIELRGTGNQHFAVFEDLDGYVVIQDPATNYHQYAKLNTTKTAFVATGINVGSTAPSALGLDKHIRIKPEATPETLSASPLPAVQRSRWEERIEEKRQQRQAAFTAAREGLAMAPPDTQTVGDYNGLCILIEFPDVGATINRAEVDDFCNKVGYSGFGNNGSVHDYFLDVSNGRMRYNNLVTEYYTAAKARSYYTDETIPFGKRAHELIAEALNHLKSQNFDFSSLTIDSAGYIRALNIFYAGPRVNSWSKGLWPHSWQLSAPFEVSSGRRFRDYQFTNMGSQLALGTFCHENGHMVCDFPDLYDYADDKFESNGIGHFCLMCAGGSDERNPVRVGAYLNRMAGWADEVTVITPGLIGTLAATRDEFLIHSKNADEYFIVEHRNAAGRDADLPSSGLAIWHIDHRGKNEHQQGTPAKHYECALEQADGLMQLEKAVNQGDAKDLFSSATKTSFGDTTNPNSRWWNNTLSGLEIRDIGAAGGEISFKIPGPGTGQDIIRGESRPGLVIPDNTALGVKDVISLDASGRIGFLKVSVDIEHTYKGDLVVKLRSPSGSIAVLHNREGAGENNVKTTYNSDRLAALGNLLEEGISGDWTLEVSDHVEIDSGSLNSWSISIRPTDEHTTQIGESVGVRIPDDNIAGITRTLTASGGGTIGTISVMIDITHSYIGDLIVTLISPNGIHVDLHNRTGHGTDNIIQTYSTVSTPALETLLGEQIDGNWQLQVSDREGQDIGKFNRWSVNFRRSIS